MMLSQLEKLGSYISIPTWQVVVLLSVFLIMQVVGEIMEQLGKAAPGIMKLRKRAQEKKQKELDRDNLLKETKEALENNNKAFKDFLSHYGADNIQMRDEWMRDVNEDRHEYRKFREESREERQDLRKRFDELSDKLDKNNEVTLSLLIDSKRTAIISFASRVADSSSPVTHEEFRRIFKIYEEYEKIISEYSLTNGEVDISIRIIREAYEDRIRKHTFVEDQRGYNE